MKHKEGDTVRILISRKFSLNASVIEVEEGAIGTVVEEQPWSSGCWVKFRMSAFMTISLCVALEHLEEVADVDGAVRGEVS